jgi:hypothetical protein
VTVFDPRPTFCDRESCFAKKGDTYLYNSDGNHLTPAGIQLLIDGLLRSPAWSSPAGG